jgi:hypothetical protein
MRRFAFTAASLLLLAHGAPARAADPPKAGGDPAAAQALFYEARALMKDGKYAVACPKFEESLRLDYGIGTEFNLADCNEKIGKLATAWSGFLSVAAAAKAQNQAQREKVARERARALEPRLPKLAIDVMTPVPPGFEVKRDGVVIGSASWGSPVPVDPGSHRIVASASGKQPWEGAVSASEGNVVRITVPRELPATPSPEVPVITSAPAPVTQRNDPPGEPQPSFPEPIIEQRGSVQRTVGWIVGGLGVAAVGVGAGFGIDSLQKRNRSNEHCAGDLCNAQGVTLRDKAMQSGDVATIAMAAGGAALLGGIVLVLTAPRGTSRKDVPSTAFRAVPHVAANGGGFLVQGVLP